MEDKPKQKYFQVKELQFSIALLVVLALLGGMLLQTISSALMEYYRLKTPVLGVFLVFGYVVLVIILSVFYTNRLVGPFRRLEYEMRLIAGGDTTRRLSIRSQDDLHIRNFVRYANCFLSSLSEKKAEQDNTRCAVLARLDELLELASRRDADTERLKHEIAELRRWLSDSGRV